MPHPKVLLVFPQFSKNSFWALKPACELWGAKWTAPPLGLITLAALLPNDWDLRLVDCNAGPLTDADLEWADLVMTGGMLPQRADTLRVIDACKSRGVTVVVGGPDAMSSPGIYDSADFRVLGEAEGLIGQLVDAWNAGVRSGTFEAVRFTADITQSPIPRFDLLDLKNYLYVGVQYSRGCPFTCEFCDIIELYGRVPRSKTIEQMLAELQALYELGYRGHVDFVDDNLIGNKKALKQFLPALANWQRERGYPFMFSTEASMNLADDQQLLDMMTATNFFAVFMGIESPDTDTLICAQKKQNTKRSLSDSVRKIHNAGIYVLAGFIVGFDTEKSDVAEGMIECIEATQIPVAMVGLLYALPDTQLTRRLEAEGRLLPTDEVPGDQCTGGINFLPLRPRREIYADYKRVLETIYEPKAFFERVRLSGRALKRPTYAVKIYPHLLLRDLRLLAKLMWMMTKSVELRGPFWRTILDTIFHNPRAVEFAAAQIVMYLHLGPFADRVISELDERIAIIDRNPEKELIPVSDGKVPRYRQSAR